MRLIIALILSALGTCQAGAEDRGKQLAAVDITKASAVEDHVRDGAPSGLPMTILVPAAPVLSATIAAAAAVERGQINAAQPIVSALH